MSYRKTLQNIRIKKNIKIDFEKHLMKSIGKVTHPIHDRTGHFVFSTENPAHPSKFTMSHEDVMELLDVRGYDIEEMTGKYGEDEKSILVKNPKKHHIKHLKQLASDLGQDSSIVSDGYNHEMHFHHGDQAGNHWKGQGSNFHRLEPKDNYSKLSDGTHFTHNFDTREFHSSRDSMNPERPSKMQKSERLNKIPYLRKSENNEHPLSSNNPETKLIHYSPKEGLTSLESSNQGSRITDTSSKQGTPNHSMNFFYLEGTKPEPVVTSGAKSKYITSLGGKKLYDRGIDSDGIGQSVHSSLKESSKKQQINPGIVSNEDYNNALHGKLKDMGYHGIYNSKLDDTMKNVVGLFGSVDVDQEHKIHPNDFKKVSAENHHESDASKVRSKDFAKENGHHNARFLHKLSSKLREGK